MVASRKRMRKDASARLAQTERASAERRSAARAGSALAAAVVVAAVAACGHQTPPTQLTTSRLLTVPCKDIIGSETAPADELEVLGRVAVAAAVRQPAEVTAEARWTHFAKRPVVVLAGRGPVTLSVSAAWRTRAAIVWGNNMTPVANLQIADCPPSPHRWNVYAGGIYTRSARACVPLIIETGRRSKTVIFGLGQSCHSG
jgi:hypothetical protein